MSYRSLFPAGLLLLLGLTACPESMTGTDAAAPVDMTVEVDAAPPPDGSADGALDLTTDGTPRADLTTAPNVDLAGNVVRLRIVASNLTSGNQQSYDDGPGLRILQALKPDIALMQEFNYGDNSAAAVGAMVAANFGAGFSYFREPSRNIPNGVISRYPIRASGVWEDTAAPDREFVWAQIDVPGARDLWAISVHLLTTDSKRPDQATRLVGLVKQNIPPMDYLVIGGDLNADTAMETALNTLGQVVVTDLAQAPQPVDGSGKAGTNASRAKPYDWVLADVDLNPLRIPVRIGAQSFPSGLVFDSRVYTPLADVVPVKMDDSGALNMQHMAVIKDFLLPTN